MDASRQPLNAGLGRWLITMTKTRESREGEEVQVRELDAAMVNDKDDAPSFRIWHYDNSKVVGGERGRKSRVLVKGTQI